jgi:DNA-binding LacI/PurR family transcriptional regulator
LGNPTIAEVARHAGVSPSTVSYVLTGNRSISPETRARVRRSIKELNYRPHAGARSMRAGKTDVVALVVPFYAWSSEQVLMPFVYGVVDEARGHGWNVMLVTSGRGASEVEDVVRSKMVDGVVLMEVRVDDERLRLVERLGVRAVSLGLPCQPSGVPFVDFDFESAGHLCVEHLVGLGHSRIGLLASPPGTFAKKLGYASRLWRGVAHGLEARGLAFHGLPMEPTPDGVGRALDALFEAERELSALIVFNESAVDLLMQALRERGMALPADISVIAVGSAAVMKQVAPPLTYVETPSVEMGRTAVRLLAGGGAGTLLPAKLVRGASTSSPPGRG